MKRSRRLAMSCPCPCLYPAAVACPRMLPGFLLRPALVIVVMVGLVLAGALSRVSGSPSVLAGKAIAREKAHLSAKELVEQGYAVRGDSWSGEALTGGRVGIRHQLFKGNEYVFTLGTSVPVEFQFAIFTKNRQPVLSELTTGEQTASVRFNPPATGTYLIVFALVSEKQERIPWSLVYAYR